jgi:hypothetical protein
MVAAAEPLTSEVGMQDGETFRTRVDAGHVVDDHIGTMEITVRSGSTAQEQIADLLEECNRLRDRVAALEDQLREQAC